jgi:hypothetical protein
MNNENSSIKESGTGGGKCSKEGVFPNTTLIQIGYVFATVAIQNDIPCLVKVRTTAFFRQQSLFSVTVASKKISSLGNKPTLSLHNLVFILMQSVVILKACCSTLNQQL